MSDDTARRWLQVLEKSDIIFFLRPYSNHLLKRTVKTPKMYFFDTGLVAYLTRYVTSEILLNGALSGAILENYVVSEIRKTYHNAAEECLIWYYRDKSELVSFPFWIRGPCPGERERCSVCARSLRPSIRSIILCRCG